MDEAVTEVGLQAQLVVVQGHQLAAGEHDHGRPAQGIDQQPQRQGRADRPQHHDEAEEGQDGRHHLDTDAQAGAREAGGVLRDPLVGVIDFFGRLIVGIEDVVGAIGQIAAQEAATEPFPPQQTQAGNQVALQGPDRQRQHQAEGVDRDDLPELFDLVGDERVFNVAGDVADADVDPVDHQDQQGDHPEHHPREPAPLPQLAAQGDKTADTRGKQDHHDRSGRTGPNRGHLLGNPRQETGLELRDQRTTQGDDPTEQQQGAAGHDRQQGQDQQQELPTTGLLNGEEVGLSQPLQLDELTAEGLQGIHDGARMPSFSPLGTQPGGQAKGRPPITCTCRWKTVCPASSPLLITVRKPVRPSCLATLAATSSR